MPVAGSMKGLGSSTPALPGPQSSGPAEESVNTGEEGLSDVAVATERQLCPLSAGLGLTEAS